MILFYNYNNQKHNLLKEYFLSILIIKIIIKYHILKKIEKVKALDKHRHIFNFTFYLF